MKLKGARREGAEQEEAIRAFLVPDFQPIQRLKAASPGGMVIFCPGAYNQRQLSIL
jgi:hypothetical protein